MTAQIPGPLALVYSQWTQFEAFPHFMQGIDEQRKLDEGRMVWRIEFQGDQTPWEAEVAEQIPERSITWHNVHGRPCPHCGSVRFEALGGNLTRVTVALEFELSPRGGDLADPLRSVISLLKWSLQRFSNFIQILMERAATPRRERLVAMAV